MSEVYLYKYHSEITKIKVLEEKLEISEKGRIKSNLNIYFPKQKYLDIANEKLNYFIIPLYNNILKFKNYEKGDKTLNIIKIFENPYLYDYISNFSNKELINFTRKINSFSKNQLTFFIYTLYEHLKVNKLNIKKSFLEDLVFRTYKKILKKGLLSNKFYLTCPETYKGFLRALKTETLYTTKTSLINGVSQRVFIKGPIGNKNELKDKFGSNWCGFNRLMIDSNLNVYSFKTDIFGKITAIKPQIIFNDINNLTMQKHGSKKYVEKFRNEFYKYIDKAYSKGKIKGLERINKIYLGLKHNTKPTKIR
jgi:hypothetical protein